MVCEQDVPPHDINRVEPGGKHRLEHVLWVGAVAGRFGNLPTQRRNQLLSRKVLLLTDNIKKDLFFIFEIGEWGTGTDPGPSGDVTRCRAVKPFLEK